MKWRDWLANWGMSSLRISTPFLDMEFEPQDEDRKAAWELYIELLTRVATQPLAQEHGDEKTALDSVYALFSTSRETIKRIWPARPGIYQDYQVVRPYRQMAPALAARRVQGSRPMHGIPLAALQERLLDYTRMLADMAGVEEDLTRIEG